MENLRKNIFDNREQVYNKNSNIDSYLQSTRGIVINSEITHINNIVKNIGFALPSEAFSGYDGTLIYSFIHSSDREIFISPEVYLVDDNKVVYEVIKPDKYFAVTNNDIISNGNGEYFCQIPLSQFLKYVSLQDVVEYIEGKLNTDYEEMVNLKKREDYLKTFNS